MIVKTSELGDEVRRVNFAEPASSLNARVAEAGGLAEPSFREDLNIDAEVYRHGTDVYFVGRVFGPVYLTCCRCTEDFRDELSRDFKFLLVKGDDGNDFEDDLGIDHYVGDEINLSPLAAEQALLALDEAPLCRANCRGLCSQCGSNLNAGSCECEQRELSGG